MNHGIIEYEHLVIFIVIFNQFSILVHPLCSYEDWKGKFTDVFPLYAINRFRNCFYDTNEY